MYNPFKKISDILRDKKSKEHKEQEQELRDEAANLINIREMVRDVDGEEKRYKVICLNGCVVYVDGWEDKSIADKLIEIRNNYCEFWGPHPTFELK